MTLALEINGLSKRFGSHQVLDDFSLDVERGEIVGLLGPNGCGKSTVLNIVCQLLPADAGRIQLLGTPIGQFGAKARSILGLCSQNSALYGDLLPEENLDFFARLYGMAPAIRRARINELMDDFGLWPHALTRVGRLSGGWQQRLHLAVSMVNRPDVLILDEPTAAIDASARVDLWHLIERLRESGTTILLTTHQLSEAQHLCNRIAVMQNGRVIAQGTVPELLARVKGQAIVNIESHERPAVMQRAMNLGWLAFNGSGELSFLLSQQSDLRAVVSALEGIEVTSVSIKDVTLEDAYFELLREHL
jgi:ABC-2 type transport system ATP-binding protein